MWWERIIELLLDKALERLREKNTPRKRMTKAFVALFTSMNNCHREYRKYRVEINKLWQENPPEEMAPEILERIAALNNQQWKRAINDLAIRIDRLRILLEIHQPELLDALDNYTIVEGLINRLADTDLKTISSATWEIAEAIIEKGVVVWDRDQKTSVEFDLVMERLREFMRLELKLTPEELLET